MTYLASNLRIMVLLQSCVLHNISFISNLLMCIIVKIRIRKVTHSLPSFIFNFLVNPHSTSSLTQSKFHLNHSSQTSLLPRTSSYSYLSHPSPHPYFTSHTIILFLFFVLILHTHIDLFIFHILFVLS